MRSNCLLTATPRKNKREKKKERFNIAYFNIGGLCQLVIFALVSTSADLLRAHAVVL